MDPMFFLLLGHIAGDYALQSDKMAAAKANSLKILALHVTIYLVSLGTAVLIYDQIYGPPLFRSAWPWFLPLFALHFIQDYLKPRFYNHSRQFYYLDQVFHLAALFALRIIVGG